MECINFRVISSFPLERQVFSRSFHSAPYATLTSRGDVYGDVEQFNAKAKANAECAKIPNSNRRLRLTSYVRGRNNTPGIYSYCIVILCKPYIIYVSRRQSPSSYSMWGMQYHPLIPFKLNLNPVTHTNSIL